MILSEKIQNKTNTKYIIKMEDNIKAYARNKAERN